MTRLNPVIVQLGKFSSCPSRQTGMATLLVTIVLLLVSMLSALAVSRSAFFEQKASGSDLRNKEVYAAAQSGIDYGIYWLEGHQEVWDNVLAGGTATPLPMNDTTQGATQDDYIHNITYTLMTDVSADPEVIRVTSTATATSDSQVTKTIQVYVMQSSFLTSSIVNGPPLLVEDCIPPGASTGTPDIHPGGGVAIGTTQGTVDCLTDGHFESFDENGASQPLVKEAATNSTLLWDSVFGSAMTETDFQALANRFPERFIYVDGSYSSDGHYSYNGSNWHTDVGSAATDASGNYNDQVILYFDESAGCPKINGSTTIYGLVYYETANCSAQGWGGGTVYGTVAIDGDLDKFNANADLIAVDLDTFGGGNGLVTVLAIIPGSWKDF